MDCLECNKGVAGFLFPHKCTKCDGFGNMPATQKKIPRSQQMDSSEFWECIPESIIKHDMGFYVMDYDAAEAHECTVNKLLDLLQRTTAQGELNWIPTNGMNGDYRIYEVT